MFRLTLKNLWAYKTRLFASALSIVLGISFLSGSFVFTDTLKGLFDDLFSSSVKGVDAQVRQIRAFGDETSGGPYDSGRAGIPISLLKTIAESPGVAAVAPQIQGYAQTINKKGKLVKTGGAPTFGFVWVDDAELNAYKIFSGRAPKPGEVMLDRALMKTTGYKIGDTVKVNTIKGAKSFKLVGDVTFGSSDSALGTTSVFFDAVSGPELLFRKDAVQSVLVRAEEGVSQEELKTKLSSLVAATEFEGKTKVEVLTGAALEKEAKSIVATVFGFINTFFSAFALVALFVSTFVISNSFSILVAQRTKEMAGLRILGASRRQILGATFGEAFFVGVIGSAIGVLGGLVMALGIKFLLEKFGGANGLPSSGLKLKPRTIAIGMGVGTVVTVLSAIAPAIKSGRVKPLAALRESAVDKSGTSRSRLILGLLTGAVSALFLYFGLADKTVGTLKVPLGFLPKLKDFSVKFDPAVNIGASAAYAILTLVFLGPLLARPVAGFFGRKWFGVVVILFGAVVGILGTLGGLAGGVKSLMDTDSEKVIQSLISGVILGVVVFGVWWLVSLVRDRSVLKAEDKRVASGWKGALMVAAVLALFVFNPLLGSAAVTAIAGWYLISTGRVAGTTSGQIARENAIRNPTRTSATALALTIGTALVSALLVLSTSLTQTFRGAYDDVIRADYIVASAAEDVGFPAEVQARIGKVPGVEATSTLQRDRFQFGFPPRQRSVGGIDSTQFGEVVNLGALEGSLRALSKPDTVAVAKTAATDLKLKIGDTINPTFRNGKKAKLTIVALYGEAEGLGNLYYLIDNKATLSKYSEVEAPSILYVRTSATSKSERAAVQKAGDKALDEFPAAEFQPKSKYVDGQVGQLQQFLNIVNALLGLAIFIAILGIANTLRLSVLERTREIGLLRAVGMSRAQLKSSIRWEAIVVATFGAVVGVLLGTGYGSALVRVLANDTPILKLTVPLPFLVPLSLLASIVGLYAARKPANDTARLNILRAIATD
jgi:ABC-type antimicrobial peptide transport system permease subunit